jgi:predicted acyltransferase
LWEDSRTWDPEGALSTLSSISTVLLGLLCGRWVRSSGYRTRFSALFTAGLAATVAGWLWRAVLPINKSLWTGSYVLYTAGIAAMVLAILSAAIDRHPRARWARPFIVFGENPLIAYAGSEIMRRILHSTIKIPSPGGRLGVDEWVTHGLHGIGLSPEMSSLGWALLYVAAWWAALVQLSRRRFLLRA